MKPEQRARLIQRAAIRAARKEIARRKGQTLTREELLSLRIQSFSIWVRLALGVIGTSCVLVGVRLLALGGELMPPGLGFVLLGLMSLLLGILGSKQTLEASLRSLGANLPELVIRAILEALN